MKNYLICFNCQKSIKVSELKKQIKYKMDKKSKLALPQITYNGRCKSCGQESIFNPEIVKLYDK